MLVRQLTRHRSESSFARYSKRALEIQAQEQVYAVFGEVGYRIILDPRSQIWNGTATVFQQNLILRNRA